MAFFRPNYNKDGKGVSKDEVPKPGFIRYFQLYFRNIRKLMGMGVIYGLVLFPLICFLVYYIGFVVNPGLIESYFEEFSQISEGTVAPEGSTVVVGSWLVLFVWIVTYVPAYIWLPLVAVSAVLYGPLTCGLTYCLRNFGREEHAWFSDFFSRAWKNKWQGLLIGLIDLLVTFSTFVYIFADSSLGMPVQVFNLMRIVAIGVFIIYTVMRWYIYPMAVTFDLRLKGLLKNAWIFVVLGLGRNLLVLVLSAVIFAFFIFFPVIYPALLPLFLVLSFMFLWTMYMFLYQFTTYPVLYRYMIGPALAEQQKKQNG